MTQYENLSCSRHIVIGLKGVAKMLLECGGDPRRENINGDTPLSLAKEKGRAQLYYLLLLYSPVPWEEFTIQDNCK